MNINSQFKQGSGCFKCRECGKQTRDTGNGESSLKMCAFCVQQAETINELQDGYITEKEAEDKLEMLKKKYNRGQNG